MNLPADCELTYVVGREAYYADAVRSAYPEPYLIVGTAEAGGSAWEFNVMEHDLSEGGVRLRLEMYEDSFYAFREIPEFFDALAKRPPRTLGEVRAILDKMGARDATPRTWQEDPEARRRSVEFSDE